MDDKKYIAEMEEIVNGAIRSIEEQTDFRVVSILMNWQNGKPVASIAVALKEVK